jgi:hypothetical protein
MAHSFARIGAGNRQRIMRANSSRAALFRNDSRHKRGNFGQFSRGGNPLTRQASSIPKPLETLSCRRRFESFPNDIPEILQMTITAAHIQPIVALIAGVLILIMPRFLNLVVAIYLIFIGLAGLGLFKMFRM